VCHIDFDTVNKALNHVSTGGASVTDRYVARDWSRVWDANRLVLDIFALPKLYAYFTQIFFFASVSSGRHIGVSLHPNAPTMCVRLFCFRLRNEAQLFSYKKDRHSDGLAMRSSMTAACEVCLSAALALRRCTVSGCRRKQHSIFLSAFGGLPLWLLLFFIFFYCYP